MERMMQKKDEEESKQKEENLKIKQFLLKNLISNDMMKTEAINIKSNDLLENDTEVIYGKTIVQNKDIITDK